MKARIILPGAFAGVVLLVAYLWNAGRVEESLHSEDAVNPAIERDAVSEAPDQASLTSETRERETGTRVAPALIESPVLDSANPLKPKLLSRYGAEDRSVADDLRLVDDALQRFWLVFKNPDLLQVGSNESIMRALAGENPEGIEFVSPENRFLNEQGSLLDRWGEPLFFHALSMTHIEVRSAGPDRKLYTDDDVFIGARAASQRLPSP